MTEAELRELPVSPDLKTAARALGIGKNQAYRMVRDGTFPIPVQENNGRFKVSKFDVLAYLHVPGYYQPETETAGGAR